MLGKLGESYGKGARKESARRQEVAGARPRLLEWRGGEEEEVKVSAARPAAAGKKYQRLSREEQGRFGDMDEIPLLDGGDEWDPEMGGV